MEGSRMAIPGASRKMLPLGGNRTLIIQIRSSGSRHSHRTHCPYTFTNKLPSGTQKIALPKPKSKHERNVTRGTGEYVGE